MSSEIAPGPPCLHQRENSPRGSQSWERHLLVLVTEEVHQVTRTMSFAEMQQITEKYLQSH